jgi:hypothetical protein
MALFIMAALDRANSNPIPCPLSAALHRGTAAKAAPIMVDIR